ncbi:MAG: VWA domain-containing protein, partial [Bdellovibrionales bacterium]|nr:VWA domain-containing protein [Bdellovibrionales bacterium]
TVLVNFSLVDRWLSKKFLYFKDFERNLITQFIKKEKKRGALYDFWKKAVLSDFRDEDLKKEYALLIKHQKRNDIAPDFLALTVPILYKSSPLSSSADENQIGYKTEIKSKNEKSSIPKKKSFENEELNPVIHSFEKLETADKYEGGRKFDSGSDELEDHAEALDEIDLSTVTTDGEPAQSIYSSEGFEMISSVEEIELQVRTNEYIYDEWNEKKGVYLENYCRLHVDRIKEEGVDLYSDFIENKYRKQQIYWVNKFKKFFNKPSWIKNQIDGTEINIDAWSRFRSDLIAGSSSNALFYDIKKPNQLDYSFAVLFDQSLSTDSWVENYRVLDTFKESLSLMSQIFIEVNLVDVLVASAHSATRKSCYLHIYKDFKDDWDGVVNKVSKVEPRGYTRLGPALRHLKYVLMQKKARKKILFIMTDGKMTDLDVYEGHRGIHDIKKAVLECQQLSINVIAVTLDKKAQPYLKQMFPHFKVFKHPSEFMELFFSLIKELK